MEVRRGVEGRGQPAAGFPAVALLPSGEQTQGFVRRHEVQVVDAGVSDRQCRRRAARRVIGIGARAIGSGTPQRGVEEQIDRRAPRAPSIDAQPPCLQGPITIVL